MLDERCVGSSSRNGLEGQRAAPGIKVQDRKISLRIREESSRGEDGEETFANAVGGRPRGHALGSAEKARSKSSACNPHWCYKSTGPMGMLRIAIVLVTLLLVSVVAPNVARAEQPSGYALPVAVLAFDSEDVE